MHGKKAMAATLLVLGLSLAAIFAAAPAYAQSGASGSVQSQVSYRTSYQQQASASSGSSVTVQTEHHLYRPGETVRVTGTVSEEARQQAKSDTVLVSTTDASGSVVAQQEATVDSSSGQYSTTIQLPASAKAGNYTAGSKVQVNASVLGLLSADIVAKLESSGSFVVASESQFEAKATTGEQFNVGIASSSNVSNFQFSQEQKAVKFTVEGQTGTTGVTHVTVPKAMLSGNMMVMVDGQVVTPDSNNVIVTSNTSTETTFELNYHHSQHEVTVTGTSVVPEFPVSMLAMAAALGSVSVLAALWGRIGL